VTSVHAPTATLRLRPGFPVLRRDEGSLQVGTRRPWAARLPDRPSVRRLLDDLAGGREPGALDGDARLALDRLLSAGLVVLQAPDDAENPSAADLLLFGDDARRRREARRTTAIGVVAEPGAATGLTELLETAGLTVDEDAAVVWLVVAAGPARRGQVDPLAQAGVPHLVVEGVGPRRRVGPFVVPGRTACVRCVDAHESEADPRLPFLVDQAAHPDTATPPVDPLLSRIALAWAARDLARYVEGDEPSTWSTTVDIDATEAPTITRWLRHPECGCAWDTMLHLP
jgi:hypothetical protein